jgi:lipoate-protein ligase A
MRVLRGRAETVSADREATRAGVERTREDGQPRVRVWRPHPHVAFGRRDANREGYNEARQVAADRGYAVADRAVGGHAVALPGTTVTFAAAEPVEESRTGIQERYDRAASTLAAALAELGVDVEEGEPDGAFCPGTHSLSATGKIVGLAQRVRSDVAVVSGVVVVQDHREIADVLEPVYEALSIPFDPDAVGSVARAGGETEPVRDTIERHFAGPDPVVETVREP